MKLKSLIAFAGVACAAASYGDATTVSTDNTLCRIKFTTSEKEVLIGLPLVDVGGTAQTINATNYISTVGLNTGATLLGKVDGTWYFWEVSNGAWAKTKTVDANSTYTAGDNASFARGSAVRLKFNDSAESHTVYLYGQVANASTTGIPVAVAGRNANMPTYTLLSNINAAEIDISDLKQKVSGAVAGDKIAVISSNGVGQKEYTYADGNWKEDVFTTVDVTVGNSTIPTTKKTTQAAVKTFKAGEGFWYITAKGTGDVTFTW